MQIKIKYFGLLTEITNCQEEYVNSSLSTVKDLLDMLHKKYPELKDEIIMSTLVHNEDNYIKQWIIYHLNIGINRIIIYDNLIGSFIVILAHCRRLRRRRRRKNFPRASKPHPPCTQGYHIP